MSGEDVNDGIDRYGDQVEADRAAPAAGRPVLARAGRHRPPLGGIHGLGRGSMGDAGSRLDLDQGHLVTAPADEIDLAPTAPKVAADHVVAVAGQIFGRAVLAGLAQASPGQQISASASSPISPTTSSEAISGSGVSSWRRPAASSRTRRHDVRWIGHGPRVRIASWWIAVA